MNFHLLLIVKDVVKECTLQQLFQKSCIRIQNTTHMSIELNKYKYIELDIFCLIGPPYILQSDNGKEFKNIDLAKMIRELWPGCKIVNGRPRHPQSQGSVERVNKEIKKVLGALMRKNNDLCCVKYVPIAQHSINTSPHSTLRIIRHTECYLEENQPKDLLHWEYQTTSLVI